MLTLKLLWYPGIRAVLHWWNAELKNQVPPHPYYKHKTQLPNIEVLSSPYVSPIKFINPTNIFLLAIMHQLSETVFLLTSFRKHQRNSVSVQSFSASYSFIPTTLDY